MDIWTLTSTKTFKKIKDIGTHPGDTTHTKELVDLKQTNCVKGFQAGFQADTDNHCNENIIYFEDVQIFRD